VTADTLLTELATRHQGHLFVAECKLGSSFIGTRSGAAQRMDAWAMKPTFSRDETTGYEIKTSRSDFQRDIRSGKWRAYLPACRRFYFVAPAQMLDKREIPEEAGLIEVSPPISTLQHLYERPTIGPQQAPRTLDQALREKPSPTLVIRRHAPRRTPDPLAVAACLKYIAFWRILQGKEIAAR